MKKLATLLLAAGMVVASTAPANAIDTKVDGRYRFSFMTGQAGFDGANKEVVQQRFRLGLTFAASENVKGYVQFQMGKTQWGTAEHSGGNNAGDVDVRQSYIDFTVPATAIKVRMGRQCLGLPADAFGENAVMSSGWGTRDGVVVTAPVNDWLGFDALWTRVNFDGSKNLDTNSSDDIYAAIANLKFDGFKASVYAAYATLDADTYSKTTVYDYQGDATDYDGGYTGDPNHFYNNVRKSSADGASLADYEGSAYWIGFTSTLSFFDPFTVKVSAAYGEADPKDSTSEAYNQNGWNVQAKASYKAAFGTPVFGAWYFSGDDKKLGDGTMPHVAGAFVNTTSFHDGSTGLTGGTGYEAPTGNWGLQAGIEDVSFVKDLSHTFLVTYFRGTNDKALAADVKKVDGSYLTSEDYLVSFDFNTTYQLYKNLAAHLELSYIISDFDKQTWGDKKLANEEDDWKAELTFDYKF